MSTIPELADEMRWFSRQINIAISEMSDQAERTATAEAEYRLARARAWLLVPANITQAAHREAWVDGETAELRKVRDLAAGLGKTALEKLRAHQSQLSAVQTELGALREEAKFARTGGGT